MPIRGVIDILREKFESYLGIETWRNHGSRFKKYEILRVVENDPERRKWIVEERKGLIVTNDKTWVTRM